MAQQSLTPAREDCNKYDLPTCWCSLFLISSLPRICSGNFNCMGAVGEK
jgi:hypothetical protein